jgi:DNA-binding transcriptional LysR family regulator
VKQAFVAAGLGVTTTPGLALRSHHLDGVQATALPVVRRIYLATYGEPPDPPATAAFIAALQQVG